MAEQLVAFACNDSVHPFNVGTALTGPKYSGKSLAIMLLAYALPTPSTWKRSVLFVQREASYPKELLARLKQQVSQVSGSSVLTAILNDNLDSIQDYAAALNKRAKKLQNEPYALVLDRAEVLDKDSESKPLLVALCRHARYVLYVASPQGLLKSKWFEYIRCDYICLSLPHTPEQQEGLWEALGVKQVAAIDSSAMWQIAGMKVYIGEQDFRRLESLATQVSFLPGLVAKLVDVVREKGKFDYEAASLALELDSLWSEEFEAFERKAKTRLRG